MNVKLKNILYCSITYRHTVSNTANDIVVKLKIFNERSNFLVLQSTISCGFLFSSLYFLEILISTYATKNAIIDEIKDNIEIELV